MTDLNHVDSILPSLDEEIVLGALLGQGSAGAVFEGLQRGLERTVAVKRLHGLAGQASQALFEKEALVMARVAHPHIVPVLCHGLLDGAPALVMEKIDGCDLAGVIGSMRADGPLPSVEAFAVSLGRSIRRTGAEAEPPLPWPSATPWWRVAATLVAQLARALDHAHRSGVVHRDLKPGNVLVSRTGAALLGDFGIAVGVAAEPASPSTPGNLAYSAPEEVQGEPSTPASDLYSLGVIARELVSLESPYGGQEGQAARVFAIDQGHLKPLDRHLPADLRAILGRATALDPAARYPSCGDLARDLEALLEGRAVSVRPEGAARRLGRMLRQNPGAAGIAGLLMLLLIAVPAAIQFTRLRSAVRVQHAAEKARGHLETALDGIDGLLLSTAVGALQQKPRLDRARTELLKTAMQLCSSLLATMPAGESDELKRRIEGVRADATERLVSAYCQLGDPEKATALLAGLAQLGVANDVEWKHRIAFLGLHVAHAQNNHRRVEELAPAVLKALDEVAVQDDRVTLMRVNAMNATVESALKDRRFGEAAKRGKLATQVARRWVESSSDSKPLARRELSRVLGNYAAALLDSERHAEARDVSREALVVVGLLKSSPEIRRITAIHWNNIGAVERQLGNFVVAEEAERQALSLQAASLSVSPTSVWLRFVLARTRFRLALSLKAQGRGGDERYELLDAATRDLGEVCALPTSSREQHVVLAAAALGLGQIELDKGRYGAALEACEISARSCVVAKKSLPDDRSVAIWHREAWKVITGIRLSRQPGAGEQVLQRYREAFPGDAEVARHAASMYCVLAGRARSGKIEPEGSPAVFAEGMDQRALDSLEEAIELGGMTAELLMGHPTWKSLHSSARFQELAKRVR